MPFRPGPETLIIAILFKLVIPFTGVVESTTLAPISVPGASGLLVFFIKHGIWNCAIGKMVLG